MGGYPDGPGGFGSPAASPAQEGQPEPSCGWLGWAAYLEQGDLLRKALALGAPKCCCMDAAPPLFPPQEHKGWAGNCVPLWEPERLPRWNLQSRREGIARGENLPSNCTLSPASPRPFPTSTRGNLTLLHLCGGNEKSGKPKSLGLGHGPPAPREIHASIH